MKHHLVAGAAVAAVTLAFFAICNNVNSLNFVSNFILNQE